MKFFMILYCVIIPLKVFSHLPYIRNNIFTKQNDLIIKHEIEKCVGIYDTFQSNHKLKMVKFTLSEKDFNPDLTLHGINEETEQMENIKLLVTDSNGVTGRKLKLGSYIPACKTYENFLTTIILVGPKQEYLNDKHKEWIKAMDLPIDVKKDEGVFIVKNDIQGNIWYEKYARKYYYKQNSEELILSRTGDYKVYLIGHGYQQADYVLIIGFVEVWNVKEIVQAVFNLPSLLHNGEISNKRCRRSLKR